MRYIMTNAIWLVLLFALCTSVIYFILTVIHAKIKGRLPGQSFARIAIAAILGVWVCALLL